ncbi:hypothetical protein Bca101_036583 [Brassica carinata]
MSSLNLVTRIELKSHIPDSLQLVIIVKKLNIIFVDALLLQSLALSATLQLEEERGG